MLYYFNPLIEDGIFYSCDSLRYSFELPDIDTVESFLSFLSHLPGCTHYHSLKDFDYRYLFVFGIKGLSFSIGLCMNGIKKETVLQGFLDFNPNKILGEIVSTMGNSSFRTVFRTSPIWLLRSLNSTSSWSKGDTLVRMNPSS